jgi:hypothetical protein
MGISRRGLLQFAPVMLAAAIIPKRLLADTQSASFADLSQESFGGCVNTSFEAVDRGGKSIWVTLTSVEDLTSQIAELNRSAWQALPLRAAGQPPRLNVFALHFYGPPGSLAQGTYTMNHATLGSFAIFLVPDGYSSYTAIVNRLLGRPPEPPRTVTSKTSTPR